MSVNEDKRELFNIKVVGIGEIGSNAVNHMIDADLKGTEFIVADTDTRTLEFSNAPVKFLMGRRRTEKFGAIQDPHIRLETVFESKKTIRGVLKNSDLVFIVAELSGITGAGAGTVITEICRELEIWTVAIVTIPFLFKRKEKVEQAEKGINVLKNIAGTIIIIPNGRRGERVWENESNNGLLERPEEILCHAVKGIADLIMMPGLIGLDLADVKSIVLEMKCARMGVGIASGEGRALKAARGALSSPLLDDTNIHDTQGVLLNITGGSDITLHEINEILSLIRQEAHENAHVICGATVDKNLGDTLRVTIIADGANN